MTNTIEEKVVSEEVKFKGLLAAMKALEMSSSLPNARELVQQGKKSALDGNNGFETQPQWVRDMAVDVCDYALTLLEDTE